MNSANISATVESIVANLIASRFAAGVLLEFARLHDGRMQIKIMRHDGRADDADGDVEHVLIFQDFRAGNEAEQHRRRRCGLEKNSSAAKQPPMVAMSVMTSASM